MLLGLRHVAARAAAPPARTVLREAVRCSRVGKLEVKIPPNVKVDVVPVPAEQLPPFRPFSKKRIKYALRNRPTRDGFAAFGEPTRVVVEGPLGKLAFPVHSYCAIETTAEGALKVTPQCGGTTKLGRTLWGTTRGYLQNAVRGVSQGFRKELELHGVGFRARVEPQSTAAPPAGERMTLHRIGTEKYGQSFNHKQPGPTEPPDPMLGGALDAGAGGGYRKRRAPLKASEARSSAAADGQALMLRIGFSHELRIDFPPHLEVSTPTSTNISIFGIDKQQVGLAAQRIRLLRKPDAYKGKGIRYVGETVKLKAGKRR